MKQYIFLLFLIICSYHLTSCSEDSFSTVVEVDLSEYGNQMVVLAPFQPNYPSPEQAHFSIQVVKSNDILNENNVFENITDATVDIFEENELISSLSYSGSDLFLTPQGIAPNVGKSYRIEVNSPIYGKVTANSYVPNPVNIKRAFISDENYYDVSEGREKVEITFEVEDEVDVENYYYLSVYSSYEDGGQEQPYYWTTCFSSNDPIFDEDEYDDDFFEGEDGTTNYYCEGFSTFRDLIFEGESKTVKIYIDQYDAFDFIYNPDTGEVEKVLKKVQLAFGSMSRDIYNYKRSAKSQYWNVDNPFAEPIRVYSNIEGGIGIFGGFVETGVELD